MTTLTLTWEGFGGPSVGVFLKTPKGRTAYEVCSMREIQMREDPKRGVRRWKLNVERWPAHDLPEGVTLLIFHWNPRK